MMLSSFFMLFSAISSVSVDKTYSSTFVRLCGTTCSDGVITGDDDVTDCESESNSILTFWILWTEVCIFVNSVRVRSTDFSAISNRFTNRSISLFNLVINAKMFVVCCATTCPREIPCIDVNTANNVVGHVNHTFCR